MLFYRLAKVLRYTSRGIRERAGHTLPTEDTMRRLSRNAQVLKFLLQQCKGAGRTRLQKLAYLADLESRKLLGKPVSEFQYIWHDHGPFDSALYDAIQELDEKGYATQSEIDYGDGYVEKRVRDTGKPALLEFSPAQIEILSYIVKRYTKTPLKQLLDDVVYETEPMEKVQRRGDRLPMDEMNNVDRERLGFDLEKVIEAEKGNDRLAKDFFNELRSKALARG